MKVWICNGCHAEIPQKEKPESCPVCKQHVFSFKEGERPDPDPEDEKYSKIYLETLKELEKYDEGCEPESTRYFCTE